MASSTTKLAQKILSWIPASQVAWCACSSSSVLQ